jgi:hypothetical protein
VNVPPARDRGKGEGPRSMSPRAFGWTVRDDSVLPDASPAPSRRVTGGLRVGRPARHGVGSSSVPAPPKERVRAVLPSYSDHPQGKQPTFCRQFFPAPGCSQRRPTAPQKHIRTPQTRPPSSTGSQPQPANAASHQTMSRRRTPAADTAARATANTDNPTRWEAASASKAAPGRLGTCENGDRSSTQCDRCSRVPN